MKPLPPPLLAELLAELLAQSRDLLVVTDAQGIIAWANPAFSDTTGWTSFADASLLPWLAPADDNAAADWRQRLADALSTGDVADTVVRMSPSKAAGPDSDRAPLWLRMRVGSAGSHRLWTLSDIGAERAAEASATRLGELLDTAQEFGRLGVWERDIASGRGHWDEHVFRFWGLDPARGTPSLEDAMARVHPDDREADEYADWTRRPGRYAQRYRVTGSDGNQRWIHSHWEVKADAAGVPTRAVGVMVDDTEVLALASSLNDANAQLALAVELGQIAVWRHDLRSNRMTYNRRGFEVLAIPYRAEGLSLEEVRSYIHPDDLASVVAAGQQALHSDTPTDMEARYRRSDGSWRHVLTRRVVQRDVQGQPLAFIGVALDITERRLAEEALREANDRVALATRGAGIGTWEHDLRTDEVRWDAQMYALRGLAMPTDPDEALRTPRLLREALAHPDELPSLLEATRRSLADGSMASYECRVRWPDGSFRWLASRSIPVYDEQGQPLRQIGVNWDIDERVNAEAVRREALAAQRQSEAKSQFLARMSHELRTPLNAILGFTQLLESDATATGAAAGSAADAGAAEQQQFKLRHIRQAAEHLLSLVNEVLDLSSIDAGRLQVRPEPVALDPLLQEVLAQVEPAARERAVTLQAETAGCTVLADRERLRQVLVKLLGHRVRLIAAGSTVRVLAAGDGDDIVVGIDDDGQDLTAAQQLTLFEPFSRGGSINGEEADNGANLALVKSLMACMGGRIEFNSTAGPGTRFLLRLPRADAASDPGATLDRPATEAAAPPPPKETSVDGALDDQPPAPSTLTARTGPAVTPSAGKVLYIEDNLVNVVLVQELIAQRGGLELVCETNGERGVARAREWQPDLVLIDMHLPDFDGFEVLRRLRADPAIAASSCVALSANAMPDDMSRALAAGFDDYWTKPIRFSSFLAGLDELFPNRSTA